MGIFDKIKDAIWGKAEAAPAPEASTGSAPSPTPTTNTPTAAPSPAPTAPTPSGGAAQAPVDVGAMLDAAVAKKGQKLDWKHSIVDLMKALDLDSSLENRKELAKELNYTGDTSDSATMNIWLHKALMKKLAENGGKVPADLTD